MCVSNICQEYFVYIGVCVCDCVCLLVCLHAALFFWRWRCFPIPFFFFGGGAVVKTSTKKKVAVFFFIIPGFFDQPIFLGGVLCQKKWVPLPFKTGIPKT